MNKKQALEVLTYFEELYPNAQCELVHADAYQLLVAVMLSAQTTDKKVNQVMPDLVKKFPTITAMADADLADIENSIRSIGLYRNKAKNLKAMSRVLLDKYDGVVPSAKEQLEMLPGVGRKTANVVQSVAFNIPAFAVDTHVERIAKRLGMANKKDSVLLVEQKLMRLFPKRLWNKAHHQFIFFGRYFCKSQKPNCQECKLYTICKEPLRKKICKP